MNLVEPMFEVGQKVIIYVEGDWEHEGLIGQHGWVVLDYDDGLLKASRGKDAKPVVFNLRSPRVNRVETA